MTRPPLITCGITAFNAAGTIGRAVGSALAQTWRPIEIVIVDDASADETPDILAALARAHPEIRTFRQRVNGGVALARNRILAEARGEFIAFFDDDDESHPERVTLQLQRIVTYERDFAAGAPVICHAARHVVYPDGQERVEGTMGEDEDQAAPSGPAVAYRIMMGAPLKNGYGACATCSQMARRSTYHALNGFDLELRRCEDTEFNIRLALTGGHFVGIARPLVTQTMTQTSDKSLALEHQSFRRVIDKHRPILEAKGSYRFCRSWLDAKQAWLERHRLTFLRLFLALALAHPALTGRRLWHAVPHLGLNLAFRRFHSMRQEG